jgi:hypothetical protein
LSGLRKPDQNKVFLKARRNGAYPAGGQTRRICAACGGCKGRKRFFLKKEAKTFVKLAYVLRRDSRI